MRTLSPDLKKTMLTDLVILLLCALGIYNISNKSNLPFELTVLDSKLIITNIEYYASDFVNGDFIVSLENKKLKTTEEIEIFLDGKTPGQNINITILRGDQLLDLRLHLIHYYSSIYNIIASIVGCMFFFVAIIILIKCGCGKIARAVHWSFVFTASIIMMTWGNYSLLPLPLAVATRVGFHVGYLFAPVFFLQFAIIFPSQLNFKTKNIINILYTLSTILTLALSIIFFLLVSNTSMSLIKAYIVVFDLSSAYMVLITLSAILVFVHTYTTTLIETDRKKLRWILLGFILGPFSYLTLWVIPSRIWSQPFVPEAVVLLLVAFVPITFGIAIIKHRLMNIDIIFKRGIVYTVVITILLIIYATMLSAVAKLLNNPSSEVSSIIAAISIALLFQPAKTKVQKFVDRKFFRIEYDYRLALNLFFKEIKDIHNINKLTTRVIELVDNLFPVNKSGFFIYNNQLSIIELTAHKNFEDIFNTKIPLQLEENLITNSLPISGHNRVEKGVNVIKDLPQEFIDIGAELVFTIKSTNHSIHGFLVLGEKKSETNFTAEDMDLLNIITSRLSLTFDRIKLQEEVIREHLETERLEELNKLKSYFVSSVSHDLKTPLTSIKMFAEILKSSNNISPEKAKDYYEIIEGESNRLTRLIDNVLNYSTIEKGIKKYNFQIVEINQTIRDVLKLMEYQFKIQNFGIEKDFHNDNLIIWGDKDAIIEVIINIISNSIKFSAKKKLIHISTDREDNYIFIKITDNGIGISKEDIEKMFQAYFKSDKNNIEQNSGAGLGMSIVKHIMNAHKGRINITSEENKGTTVSLEFPLKDVYD